MTKTFDRELYPEESAIGIRQRISGIMLSMIYTVGILSVFYIICGNAAPGIIFFAGAAAVGTAVSALQGYMHAHASAKIRKLSVYVGYLLIILPCLFILMPGIGTSVLSGWKIWFNFAAAYLNSVYDLGIGTFAAIGSQTDLRMFIIFISYLTGGIAAYLFDRAEFTVCGLAGISAVTLLLMCRLSASVSCACVTASIIGLIMSGRDGFSRCGARIWLTFAVLLMASALLAGNKKEDGVARFRGGVVKAVHELRYGRDTLPLGDLREADILGSTDDRMLSVRTGQAKNIYLKGFTGAVYEDGRWREPHGASYRGNYSGMLKWLKEQDFDPLTQVYRYHSLSNNESLEENRIIINVTGASRYFIYTPSAGNLPVNIKPVEDRDQRYLSSGITGERIYSIGELSGMQPSELSVAEDWVTEPENEDQRSYAEAEAVYRSFVYDTYTEIDDDMRSELNKLIWEDFDGENNSIYGYIYQLRTKLEQYLSYKAEPAEAPLGTDPIIWALENSHEANAVIYASAAVEALRAKGVPARYTEGYYISADEAAEKDGTLLLTGRDAHAWPEVYFDGIGWLPADVTPGYYYDVISLQQMVGMPDDIRRTAALDDSGEGADELKDNEAGGSNQLSTADEIKEGVKNAALIAAGITAVCIIVIALAAGLLELGRMIVLIALRRRYVKADPGQKLGIMADIILDVAKAAGIEIHPGWNTAATAAAVAEIMPASEAGVYERVDHIIEKLMYGDKAPEAYELRTVESFTADMLHADIGLSMMMRLKLRYRCLSRSVSGFLTRRKKATQQC